MPDAEPTPAPFTPPQEVVVYQPGKMDPFIAFLPTERTAKHNAALWGISCLEESVEDDTDQQEHQEVLDLLQHKGPDAALDLLEHLLQGKFLVIKVWNEGGQDTHA